ncbi:hypothetical protein T261_2222 [Streptomyces lydicus]|nr:hypothetical protein T261_2222 [Streptomyces lydicus]
MTTAYMPRPQQRIARAVRELTLCISGFASRVVEAAADIDNFLDTRC